MIPTKPHMKLDEIKKRMQSPDIQPNMKALLQEVALLMELCNVADSSDVMDRITAIRFTQGERGR